MMQLHKTRKRTKPVHADSDGNGAREALARLFDDQAVEMPDAGCFCALCSADYALMWLWQAGFKLVPVEDPC
jgi:hypothetical protein